MSSELKELRRQERQLKNTFKGVRKFIDRFKKEQHSGQINSRLEMLESSMKKYYSILRKMDQIMDEMDEEDDTDAKESDADRAARLAATAEQRSLDSEALLEKLEDDYCEMKALLQSLHSDSFVEQPPKDPEVKTQNPTSTVKLPELRLPSFGGRLREWVTFRDMFKSLIHRNHQLSEMDKFSYLRSSLVGEALQEIGSLEMTSANYSIAWDLLQKRYENKKLIVKAHLDALFAVEPMKRESYEGLNHIISEYDRHLQMMEKIGEDTKNWSTILVHMVCSRLDTTTLRHWESHHCSKDVPKYDDLMMFLRNQCSVLQSIAPERPTNLETRKAKSSVSHPSTRSTIQCPFCGESLHSAFKCQKFLKLKVSERYEKVKKCGLCLNCFSPSHLVRFCTKGVCQHCQRKHHSLLHMGSKEGGAASSSSQTGSSVPLEQNQTQRPNNQPTQPHAQNQHQTPHQNTGQSSSSFPIASTESHPKPTTDPTPSSHTNSLPVNMNSPSHHVLLSTALVRITDQYGNVQLARALLDSCSEYCFISKNLCKSLKLEESVSHMSIAGIGCSSTKSTKMVNATVHPRSLRISSYSENIPLHVLPKLTANLPIELVDVQQLAIPEHLLLADPGFFKPGPIDLIIGAEYYYDLLTEGRMKLFDEGPTLQETVFGWVVSGRVPGSTSIPSRTLSTPCAVLDLQEWLAKFWELESCSSRSTLSVEESMCEEIFERTTTRDENGRFVVTLPKKEGVIQQLGDSKTNALKRLYGLERRFAANGTLKKLYCDFIDEYLSMGHMEEVSAEDGEPIYYMPHHAVLKPDSTTTQLRVVYNASCKTSTGISLNDGLMVGPVVQDDLLSITLRFRFRRFAIVADVAKMYRMIKVCWADLLLTCIYWRRSPDEPVKTYKLTTVTYGTSSAPYLATKCLQRLGTEGEATHPIAAKIVKKDFYVDDVLTGADTLEEAKVLVEQLIDLTNSAGFILRKFSSNSPELLSCIPSEFHDERTSFELDSSTSSVKTLGIVWTPATDTFGFRVPKFDTITPITKRTVLAESARIFDPLGLVGPVVVQAKIFLQVLWKEKCDWDDVLSEDLQNFWLEYRRNLLALDTLSIPRWVSFTHDLVSVEVHGFSDASQVAYGACLYLRCVATDGSITVRLITAKSRVAPLEDLKRKKKTQTIPRLELSAALLLSHLYEKFCSSVEIPFPSYFWTDSTIVKYWLASPPSRWQIFVANRVSEIQHITKNGVWNHVSGADNPADIISRGMTPAQLKYETLWFEGPLWLRQHRSTWPSTSPTSGEVDQSLLEEKTTVAMPVHAKPPNEIFLLRSSFTDLARLVAYVRRFLHNITPRNRNDRRTGCIKLQELNDATTVLVRIAQEECFPAELANLSRNREVNSSSKILGLHPILVNKTLRVGGRLAHAPVSENRKHPMILHHKHPFTKLVLRYYHLKHFHAGHQLLIASVREKFWPTNARSIARKICHECIPCFRNSPKVHEQLMADLPSSRVTPSAVFLKVGVDFCGPFYIRYPIRRSTSVKCYVAIFVCLVTKAVHLEIVADLSTQAFLAALKRFVAIRGKPQVIMCDNATNFVGASRELEELRLQFLDQQFQHTIVRTAEDEGIEFDFIPARSPNFGGLWEAAVKSFKGHFRKVIGTNQLSYDELHTFAQQAAAILNSRPITPLSSDPNDFEALTPGHFIIGRPLTAIPEPDLQDIPDNQLSAWQRTQGFVQQLWRKWKTHYLSDLHNRTKWTRKRDNVKIGTMVLVKEDNLPPQRWKLGRIVDVFAGSDGNIRVVNVRTKDGTFNRGISKICVLPIKDNAPSADED